MFPIVRAFESLESLSSHLQSTSSIRPSPTATTPDRKKRAVTSFDPTPHTHTLIPYIQHTSSHLDDDHPSDADADADADATSSTTISPTRMTIKPHDRKPTRASEAHPPSEKAAERTDAMHATAHKRCSICSAVHMYVRNARGTRTLVQ
jgi:hypothetical protein